MRTTIKLPQSLADAARRHAASQGRTFTSVVEEALRELLDKAAQQPATRERLPTHGDPDTRPLINLSDREALWEALDGDDT
ncbi:type II toxin-antitoxin system VapB family antitoxin [Euzebya tangerina]|uniref:type II toxin-antitoxin system VapB family antitoxin n=1 Tax=Euzebya tangerina TaxID=591198 RepID=UPI000E3157E6|nr:type II toxin-antitoxin system VapB family antitoxin [Euzebya tangerina]